MKDEPHPEQAIRVPKNSLVALSLCMPGGEGQYLISSHCWGGADIEKLTTSRVPQFVGGVDIGSLPKHFQDTFIITCSLGFEFRWIDALCIVQKHTELLQSCICSD